MNLTKGVTLAMVAGEPMVVFWRREDFGAALAAAEDMGLPVTSPKSVEDELLRLLLPHLAQLDGRGLPMTATWRRGALRGAVAAVFGAFRESYGP